MLGFRFGGSGVAAASLLWLPAGFHLGLALTGGAGLAEGGPGWLYPAALAAGGVPLALACRLLWRRGRGWAAFAAFAVLGPAAVAGTLAFEGLEPLAAATVAAGGEPAGVADECAPPPGPLAGGVKLGRGLLANHPRRRPHPGMNG